MLTILVLFFRSVVVDFKPVFISHVSGCSDHRFDYDSQVGYLSKQLRRSDMVKRNFYVVPTDDAMC